MPTDPVAALLPLAYGPVYGSLYFAVVMASALYGVTCMQTFLYFSHSQKDSLHIKILVAAAWTLNTIHESLVISGAYKYFMAGWVNVASINTSNPELMVLLTALVATPTQGFFVHRLYIFSGKNIHAPLIWVVMALIQLVSALVLVVKVLYNANGVQVIPYTTIDNYTSMILVVLCLVFAAAVDILIAVFLTVLLIRKRSETTFVDTANTLQRLAVFAVNTGIWPALFALLTLILANVFPLNLFHTLFGIPLCSVYYNTLLANLNVRSYVRGNTVMHAVDADLFKSSSSPVSDSTKIDKQHGEEEEDPSGHMTIWKTTEVVTFPDVIRSTTLENV